MNRKILFLLDIIIILSVLIVPYSISADDEDLLTKEEKSFDFRLFTKASRASRYIASLRAWVQDCSSQMKFIYVPQPKSFPDKEFTANESCFFGEQGEGVPDTMTDIAALWDAEVCLRFDSVSRKLHSLEKGANLWEWTTGLEEIKGHLNSIESAISKVKAANSKRKLDLIAERKLKEEAKKDLGLKDTSCFIATAAYGTPTAVEIDKLRRFRDEYLRKSPLGNEFIRFYYENSPPIADFISEHEVLRIMVREGLVEPAVRIIELTECCWSDKASYLNE